MCQHSSRCCSDRRRVSSGMGLHSSGRSSGARPRARIPVCSTTRVKSAIVLSLMVDGSASPDCRIFGRFRPVRMVRKWGAIPHQSARRSGRQAGAQGVGVLNREGQCRKNRRRRRSGDGNSGLKSCYQLFRCQLGFLLGREVIWRHDATHRLATDFPSSPLRSDGRAPVPRSARVNQPTTEPSFFASYGHDGPSP